MDDPAKSGCTGNDSALFSRVASQQKQGGKPLRISKKIVGKMASCPHVGKSLELKSPFGAESMTYKWPLKKGKGSVRRSEVILLFFQH